MVKKNIKKNFLTKGASKKIEKFKRCVIVTILQITSLWIFETHSIRTSMSRSTSSPPSSICYCLESSTAECVGSSSPLNRPPPSKATSLSSKPSPGEGSMSWRPTTHRCRVGTSAHLPLKWLVLPFDSFKDSNYKKVKATKV